MKYQVGELYRSLRDLKIPCWLGEDPTVDYGDTGSFHLCINVVEYNPMTGDSLVMFYSLSKHLEHGYFFQRKNLDKPWFERVLDEEEVSDIITLLTGSQNP